MYKFIYQHRIEFGVEPICRVLQIAPSAYRAHAAAQRDVTKRCARAQRDERLRTPIYATWGTHWCVYGARKVWKELHRDRTVVARCTVERVMQQLGLDGVVRGARRRTTVPDELAARPLDLIRRDFTATRPNQRWVANFTYVATWRGVVYVAFVIDVFARRTVGWRAHTTMQTALVSDALEQALHDRELDGRLVVHSDRGSQGGLNRSSQRACCTEQFHRVTRGSLWTTEYASRRSAVGIASTHRDGATRAAGAGAAMVGCSAKSLQRLLRETGGVRPALPFVSTLQLSLAEREAISRALLSGAFCRQIAAELRGAPSTVTRTSQGSCVDAC